MTERIGIIAGSGQFPHLVARGAKAMGLGVVICGFQGNTSTDLAVDADAFTLLYLGQLSKLIEFFRSNNVTRLCMAGAISKPRALDLRPDFRAARLAFSLRGKGDDAILRAVMNELEREGFIIQNAAGLVPELCCPSGVLGCVHPSELFRENVSYGWPIASAMGRFDIGQCLVVREHMVMAVECLEGTDATLRRGGELGGEGCIALKTFKPGQEERVDLPSIGLGTIQLLAELRYSGLVVEAERTLFFDREAAIAKANAHNLCIWALTKEEAEKFATGQVK